MQKFEPNLVEPFCMEDICGKYLSPWSAFYPFCFYLIINNDLNTTFCRKSIFAKNINFNILLFQLKNDSIVFKLILF